MQQHNSEAPRDIGTPTFPICVQCGERKPRKLFAPGFYIDDDAPLCLACKPKEEYEREEEEREKQEKEIAVRVRRKEKNSAARKSYLRIKNVTEDDYNAKFEEQAGLCRVCHQPETVEHTGKVCALSMDIEDGEIKALMCRSCMQLVKALRRNPEKWNSLFEYLSQ